MADFVIRNRPGNSSAVAKAAVRSLLVKSTYNATLSTTQPASTHAHGAVPTLNGLIYSTVTLSGTGSVTSRWALRVPACSTRVSGRGRRWTEL